MKVDNQQNQEPVKQTPTVKSSLSPTLSQLDSKSFLSLVFPTTTKLSTEPEPPPKKPAPHNGAEEAATSPNANSQKLDSPLQNKKKPPETSAEADLKSASTDAHQGARSELANDGSPLAPQPLAVPSVAVDEASHLKMKASFGPHSALPVDPEVPITDIHTFTVDPTPHISEAPSTSPNHLGEVSNPSVSAILGEPNPKFATEKALGVPGKSESNFVSGQSQTTERPSVNANLPTPSHEPILSKPAGESNPEPSAHSVVSASTSSGHQMGFQHQSGQQPDSQAKPEKPANLSQDQAMDRRTLMASVVNKFETMMAARPRDGVVVQLSPKAMGNITLTLKTVGKAVETQIAASHPEVRQALSDSSPELARAIEERGYTVSGVTVESQGDQPNSFANQNSSSGASQTSSAKIFSPEQRPRIEALPLALSRLKALAGVDLWI